MTGIRLLTDADGDGKYEKSAVFADRFNGILEGTGAGLLAHDGAVFYTCIPNLWRLQDTKSQSKNRLGEEDSPVSLDGHRKIGTVPGGSQLAPALPINGRCSARATACTWRIAATTCTVCALARTANCTSASAIAASMF